MLLAWNFFWFLTPLDRLLIFLLGDAFAVLGCQALIVKALLRGVLIDRLPALDAVELGGCSFFVSLEESYWRHVIRIPNSCCCHILF